MFIYQIPIALALLLMSFCTFAFNISGVMGTKIKPNDRSFQYKMSFSPADNDTQTDNWAYRIHYQHAFSDKFRSRTELQFRDQKQFEYDFVRTELLYSFKQQEVGETWSSALRFDFRTRRGSRPEELVVNWANQWDLDNGYRVRALLVVGQHIGSNRRSNDMNVQTRASISKKLDNGLAWGIQLLNKHGSLGDFGSLSDQGIAIGAGIGGKIGRVKCEFRYVHGLTDVSRDHNFILRFSTPL